MEFELLNFIKNNHDWHEKLSNAPYNITIKNDGDYYLFMYNQYDSDFSLRIVQECRGIIVYMLNEPIIVCAPFVKFFNYSEQYAADIDWKTAHITEKIDGSLCKVWYHNGEWHLSTNGTIDAKKALVGDTNKSFYDVFCKAINMPIDVFYSFLGTDYTYMFELTSPVTQVVIPYDYGVYAIGKRNIHTLQESKAFEAMPPCVKFPMEYHFNNLNECIAFVKTFDENHEGFVVRDGNFNRIKIKGEEYLRVAHLTYNTKPTVSNIVDNIANGTIDDFIAYNRNFADIFYGVEDAIEQLVNQLYEDWNEYSQYIDLSDIEFARIVSKCPNKAYLFARRKNKVKGPQEYLWNFITRHSFIKLIKNVLE